MLCILLLGSCAIVRAPEGGPRDTVAPTVVSTSPPDSSLNTKPKTIEFEFSEYVDVSEVAGKLIISPKPDRAPKVIPGRRVVSIDFSEVLLKDSTTYTLNFQDAVKDLTESNRLTQYSYRFSTGSYIDSLALTGSIKAALSNQPLSNGKVMLFRGTDDSLLLKGQPDYITYTNESGAFTLEALPAGKFRLLVVEDGNKNNIVDAKELAAVVPQVIILPDDANRYFELYAAQTYPTTPTLTSLQVRQWDALIGANQPIVSVCRGGLDVEFNYLGSEDSVQLFHDLEGDSTMQLSVQFRDTAIDTLATLQFDTLQRFRLQSSAESLNSRGAYSYLRSYYPLANVDTSKISVNVLKDTLLVATIFDSIRLINDKRELLLHYPYTDTLIYRVKVLPSAVSTIAGSLEDTLISTVSQPSTKSVAYLQLVTEIIGGVPGQQVLLQLYTGEGAKVAYTFPFTLSSTYALTISKNHKKERKLDGIDSTGVKPIEDSVLSNSFQLTLPALAPNSYKLRLIVDEDKNGYFTSSYLLPTLLAEPVYHYSGELELRANWEILDTKFRINLK